MFKRVVDWVEALALAGALVFVIALFVNDGDGGGGDGSAAGTESPGAVIFADNCARCHGADGGGGVGPQLSDGAVVEAFPDIADQIAVITDGRGGMPSFGDALDPDEIEAVAVYTREEL
jgi:mono/diheme cytochrome c family protein